MRINVSGIHAIFTLAVLSVFSAPTALAADAPLLWVGAAKKIITPTNSQITGQVEAYNGGERTQFFHLGGFGIGPAKVVPQFGGVTPPLDITQLGNPEAKARCFAKAQLDANQRQIADNECNDNTWVRALVVQQPGGARVAFVTIDAVGAGNLIQDGMKKAIVAASCALDACLDSANILIGQTHSHAGADLQGLWGGVPSQWINQILYTAAAAAVGDALTASVPAHLVMARGYDANFNNYRRPKTNGDEESDTAVTVLQARSRDTNAVIGTMLQYAAHPTAIGDDDYNAGTHGTIRVPHPDYPLGAELELEETFGGTALYYNGPIADASGSGGPGGDNAYDSVKNRGRGLAQSAIQFMAANAVPLDPVLSVRHADVILPITNPAFVALGVAGTFNGYYQFTQIPREQIPGLDALNPQYEQLEATRNQLPQLTPIARTLVSRISIGSVDVGDASKNRLEIVTIPGEATNTFGQYIRRLANEAPVGIARPEVHTMLLGLTQNSFGYIIPEEEFGEWEGPVPTSDPYEETVSLGPLTAPLLRSEGYIPLFDANAPEHVPEFLRGTSGPEGVLRSIALLLLDLSSSCHGFADATPFAPVCGALDTLAGLLGAELPNDVDQQLLFASAEAATRGCDLLDPSHCLLPFPSDHFTVAAAAGSPQSLAKGGTGRRVNFNVLAMPRNAAGKPIDPTEWNRNDGFSPGQQIITYVPNLATIKGADGKPTGPIVGAPPITDIGQSLNVATASVVVLDAETRQPHPVWAEIDLTAGFLLPADQIENPNPAQPKQASLIVRPGSNFQEGRRYIVVLKNLKDDRSGATLTAGSAFRTCRDEITTALPQLQERCAHLQTEVFPVLEDAGIDVEDNEALYLAWDFTTASAENNIGRLRHMRDDAFVNYLGQTEAPDGSILNLGRAPKFVVTQVLNSTSEREIRGSFTVPSYVVPVDPSPLEQEREFRQQLKTQFPEFAPALDAFNSVPRQGTSVNAPPNRLFYSPAGAAPAADASNPYDPLNARYGDGLPDRTGEMTTTFTCRIPKAGIEQPGSSRPIVYGHGLLGGQEERGPDQEYNMMYCKADWYGFAFGDLGNVASTFFDMSNFPVIPDGSQQGMINQLFLARLLRHPQGFAADPAFQVNSQAAYDNREVFYDGNSQGGILGGVVLALSKDITRGVLGVVGMNYSTLLQRSVDFDSQLEPGIPPYSFPVYMSYQADLDRQLVFSMIQMLWDRSENNGYAHHITNNAALKGPNKQVLLQPAFADHQVSHWSAQVMARTVGVEVADMYQRKLSECTGNVTLCFADKFAFFTERDPDTADFWNLPLVGRDAGAAYDTIGCTGSNCRTSKSAFVEFDEGRTAAQPIGNVPNRADGFDPHGFPRGTIFGKCQKSHFLHSQGRVIDVRETRNVTSAATCPALPATIGTTTPAESSPADLPMLVLACLMNADPECLLDAVLQAALEAPETGTDAIADLTGNGPQPDGPVGGIQNASCTNATNTSGNRSYQVFLTGHDGETVSFQVLEPTTFACAGIGNGAHPLLMHGPGYSGSRSTSGFTDLRNKGYTVISVDPRGFGDSTGTVRTMDPEFEGQYLVQILNWAEQNLDYLAWRNENSGAFIARPVGASSVAGGDNLVVGAMGGSYGGGYQLLILMVDGKKRLDAIQPDITWHDLRNSLNPGDVTKSLWDLALTALGEGVGHSSLGSPVNDGQDPFIKETLARGVATNEFPRQSLDWFRYHGMSHWCEASGLPFMPYVAYGPDAVPMQDLTGGDNVPPRQQGNGRPGFGTYLLQPAGVATHFQGLSVLLTQGMVDTLFNFNEAWWNYQCLTAAGAEVNLLTHNSGHVLPAAQSPDGAPAAAGACPVNSASWFDSKLKPSAPNVTLDEVCFVFSGSDKVALSAADVLAPQPSQGFTGGKKPGFTGRLLPATVVPNGLFGAANAEGANAIAVPLGTVAAAGVLAGLPFVDVMVATPGGINELAQDCGDPMVPTVRLGCDSIIFAGLGLRTAGSTPNYKLIDDQVIPLRGLGRHRVDMVGVSERLPAGSQLALLLYGQHAQFFGGYSRDASIPAVSVSGMVKLPIYGLDINGQPKASLAPAVLASNTDSDGDGKLDGADLCPNTPPDQRPVDANGCAASERDTDGDGVKDNVDICADTPAGEIVNAAGCSASQRDTDGDGVKDDVDQCLTQAGPASNDGCPLPPDTTPNAFSFNSVSGVSQSTTVSSNVVTITGIDASAAISVQVGEYRINSGTYTSTNGVISPGQTVQVRHTSAAIANTITETSLNIGGVLGNFRSTTAGGADTDPAAFSFTTQTGVAQSTPVISNTIIPAGYDAPTTVKAGSGTEYSIGCNGNFTALQGTISPTQSICVRHTTAGTANTLRKTSLQIGKTVAYFSTRTSP